MSDPARLPKGAPPPLRQFVRCEVDDARLDLNNAEWLNEIPLISGATTSARSGSTPNSATITFDAEWTPKFDLEIAIVDGELTATVPGAVGAAANGPITTWVNDLNATLAANDKELRDLSVNGTMLRLRKQPIPPPVDDPPPGIPPVVEVPAPKPDTEPELGGGNGCLTKILVGVTAALVAIGIVAATRSGGDNDSESADIVVSESVSESTTPPAIDPPATTSTTTTTTTTTTISQVGAVDDTRPGHTAFAVCLLFVGQEDDRGAYGEIDVPDGNCDPENPATVYSDCDPAALPCSSGQTPPFLRVGEAGTDHQRQVADATTGQTGASTLEEMISFLTTGLGPTDIRTSATCAGSIVTGAGTASNGEIITIDSPLFQFGTCTDRSVQADLDGVTYEYPQLADHVVDASEPDPRLSGADYAAVTSQDVFETWLAFADIGNDVNTINNVIGGRAAVDDGCVFFFEPQNVPAVDRVLDGCSGQSHYWVFAAATTNVDIELTVTDHALGTTATYANPLGQRAPSTFDTSAFTTTDTMTDNSIFPCGFGFVAYTACAAGEPPIAAGALVTVSAALANDVPLISDGVARSHSVDFAATGGPLYSVDQDGDEWIVSSSAGATRTRAVIRGNAITFLVPSDELPDGPASYQWSTEVDDNVHAQPIVPVIGVITTPEMVPPAAAPPPVASESLADFYSQLSASVAAGDVGFALDRLHPVVFEAYPTECPAALESFADPDLVIEFIADNGPEPWTWELSDARTFEVPDAVSVTLRLSGRGQEGTESSAHVALVDGEYRWFTFC